MNYTTTSINELKAAIRKDLNQSLVPHDFFIQNRIKDRYTMMFNALNSDKQTEAMCYKIELMALKEVQSTIAKYEWIDL